MSVLSVDYSIDCNAEGYRQFYYAVVLVILAVPIGIPVVTLLILRAHKDDLLKGDPKASALLESSISGALVRHSLQRALTIVRCATGQLQCRQSRAV